MVEILFHIAGCLTALSLGLRLSAFGPPCTRTEGELKMEVIEIIINTLEKEITAKKLFKHAFLPRYLLTSPTS
jgi:hypothetical protein